MFRALNADEEGAAGDANNATASRSREMEVEECLETYTRVVKLQQGGAFSAAKLEYEELLARPLFSLCSINRVQRIQDSPIHTLFFVVFSNYARVLEKLDRTRESLRWYQKAVSIDPTSSATWRRIGTIALSEREYRIACEAFESGLQCSETSTDFWLCLDGLCQATLQSGDLLSCKAVVKFALDLDAKFAPAKELYNLLRDSSKLAIARKNITPTGLYQLKATPYKYPVQSVNWVDLSRMLLKLTATNATIALSSNNVSVELTHALVAPLHVGQSALEESLPNAELEPQTNGGTEDSDVYIFPQAGLLDDSMVVTKKRRRKAESTRVSKRARTKDHPVAVTDGNLMSDEEFEAALNEKLPSCYPHHFGWEGDDESIARMCKELRRLVDPACESDGEAEMSSTREKQQSSPEHFNISLEQDASAPFSVERLEKLLLESDGLDLSQIVIKFLQYCFVDWANFVSITSWNEQTPPWPVGLPDSLVDLLSYLGTIGYHYRVARKVSSADGGSEEEAIFAMRVYFGIAELYLSRIMEEESSAAVQSLWDSFEPWWFSLQCSVDIYANRAKSHESALDRIRFSYLSAKILDLQKFPEEAVEAYQRCLRDMVTDSVASFKVSFSSTEIVEPSSVKKRIYFLTIQSYVLGAMASYRQRNFREVVNRLSMVFLGVESPLADEKWGLKVDELDDGETLAIARKICFESLSMPVRHELMQSLSMALMETGCTELAFVGHVRSLWELMRHASVVNVDSNLIDKINHLSSELVEALRNDSDSQLLEGVQRRSAEVDLSRQQFLEYGRCNTFAEFVASVLAAVRMAWFLMRQATEIKLPDVLGEFVTNSWKLMLFLAKAFRKMTQADESTSPSDPLPLIEEEEYFGLISLVHSQLGEVGLCSADKGDFLKICLNELSTKPNPSANWEVYQCYCCLYSIVITIDPDHPMMEHNAPPLEFTKSAAVSVYRTIYGFIIEKLEAKNYRAISTDVRDALEQISEVFPEPPWENKFIAYNRDLITQLLSSEIKMIQPSQIIPLATFEVKDCNIPEIYQSIFCLRGKLASLQPKPRGIAVKSVKILENMELATEDFLHDLYINPRSFETWLSLASIYSNLANECLAWSANQISENFADIRTYQMKSYHCFCQALALLKESTTTPQVFSAKFLEIWSGLGWLCYSILAKPMSCAAVKSSQRKVLSVWSERANAVGCNNATNGGITLGTGPSDRSDELPRLWIAKTGYTCFAHAMKYDSKDWQLPLMAAKFLMKSRRKSNRIIELLKSSMALVPKIWSTKEQENIIDPHYVLVSYLCKRVWDNSLEPADVDEHLAERDPKSVDGSDFLNRANGGDADPRIRAFKRLALEILYLRSLDKKRWQHKPTWKLHWIYKEIFGDVEKAKMELMSLFQLKSVSRSFNNFWKPEFERPGRHFVFIHQYTSAIIPLLRATNDLESLKNLGRKVRKADDSLLYPQTIWRACFEASVQVLRSHVPDWERSLRLLVDAYTVSEFLGIAVQTERAAFLPSSMAAADNGKGETLQQLLLSAFQIKKLNEGDEDESEVRLRSFVK
ncbi:hypothetical protein DFJ73DRAFT_849235 [Zopfochytrium polystomum]|nr:hypothetical protein DFJ73DRAFT_849235 [Zopfochytrium polystomum]